MSLDSARKVPCSSCGALMVWVRMAATGKMNPIDPTPVADGNVALSVATDDSGNPVGRVLKRDEMHVGARYKSHFATCPNGPAHRHR